MKENLGERIGVLAGGPSSEREVSLSSGRCVYEALKGYGLDVVLLDVCPENVYKQLKKAAISLAFIAMHGRLGEDGTLQEILEELDISYTGSGPASSKIAMNKALTKKVFLKEGISTPEYEVTYIPETALSFPVVVKPLREGSTIGVSVVKEREGMREAIEKALRFDSQALVEEYIEGVEVTVPIIGNHQVKTLPSIEIVPTREGFYTYEAKYSDNGSVHIIPPRLSPSVQRKIEDSAIQAHKVLGCWGLPRVDMIVSAEETPFI